MGLLFMLQRECVYTVKDNAPSLPKWAVLKAHVFSVWRTSNSATVSASAWLCLTLAPLPDLCVARVLA